MKFNRSLLLFSLVLVLSSLINGELLGGLISTGGGLLTGLLGTTTTSSSSSSSSTTSGPIIDIDLGPISLELYLAFQDPVNQNKFITWTQQNNKTYDTNAEFNKRYKIFVDNLLYVQNFQNANPTSSITLGMTYFADLTNAEYRSIYTVPAQYQNATTSSDPLSSPSQSVQSSTRSLLAVNDLSPSSLDYSGGLPPIKFQGTCNAGNIFASLVSAEYNYFKQTYGGVSLSVQEVIDCHPLYYSGTTTQANLCNGESGLGTNQGYFYMGGGVLQGNTVHYGVSSETTYPWVGTRGTCKYNTFQKILPYSRTTSWDNIVDSESDLAYFVWNYGPVGAAIAAGSRKFQLYTGGVWSLNTQDCVKSVDNPFNHAVSVVGYGFQENTGDRYWLIRNSYGNNWGQNGYMRVTRANGQCLKMMYHATFSS